MNVIKDIFTTFHGLQIIFISISECFEKFFYNFICFIINHDFYVITFWMHYTLFIMISRRNKIICYCWLNLPRVRSLRLFMMSFKYDLLFKDVLEVIVFYFCQLYFHTQCNCYLKKYLFLLVYNNLFQLHSQKYF